MMKLSRFLWSRNQLFEQIVCKKTGDAGHAFGSYHFSSQAGIPGASQNFTRGVTGNASHRVLASYSVFKGKAALSISPVLPTFTRSHSGSLVINRHGVVMLKFWPAIGERKYDWEKKQFFALSPTEVGTLISLGPKDSCEFFHDPAMLSSNAGQVRKSLSIKSHAEGNGYFISLTVVNNIQKTKDNFYVPFTAGEFSVMKTACSGIDDLVKTHTQKEQMLKFALPHILGWDQWAKLPSLEEVPSKVDRQALSLEWEK